MGPIIVFIIDRIIGMRKNYKQLRIVDASILPSGESNPKLRSE